MPTYRNKIGSQFDFFDQYGFDFEKMEAFLHDYGAELWVRLHHYNKPSRILLNQIEQSSVIHFHNKEEIYSELSSFDMLITDLSSVYCDYLLLDRPIVFSAFDIAGYLAQDRSLYYEYDDVTPGPKAENWDEVVASLRHFFDDPDWYKEERQLIKQRFNSYQDGKSCERLYDEIKKRIGCRDS